MGNPHWSRPCIKDCTSWKSGPIAAVHGELLPTGRAHTGEICGELSPVGQGPHAGGVLSPGR